MKKTINIFLFLNFLFSLNLFSQLNQTDATNFRIITEMEVISPGIIKTSEVKYSYESYFGEMKKGEKIEEIETLFNNSGLPIEKNSRYWNNKTEIKYENSLIKEIKYPDDEWVVWRFTAAPNGQIIEKTEFSTNGEFHKSWNYEYNQQGQIIRRTLNKNKISDYPEILITEFYYNNNDQLTYYYTYALTSNSIGKLHRNKNKFEYNSNNQLKESVETFSKYGSKTIFFPNGLDFHHPSGNRAKTKSENLNDMNESWHPTVISRYSYHDENANIWSQKINTIKFKELHSEVDSEDAFIIEREFISNASQEIQSFLQKTVRIDLVKPLWNEKQFAAIDDNEKTPSPSADKYYAHSLNELKINYNRKLKESNPIDVELHNNLLYQLTSDFHSITDQYIDKKKNEIITNRPQYIKEQENKEKEAIELEKLSLVNDDFLRFKSNVKYYISSNNTRKRIYWSDAQIELLERKRNSCRRKITERSKRRGLGLNAWVECDNKFENKYKTEMIPLCEDYFSKIENSVSIDEKIRLINELKTTYQDALDIFLKKL